MKKNQVSAKAAQAAAKAKSVDVIEVAEAIAAQMDEKAARTCAGLVLAETMSLNQAIKVFNGLWSKPLVSKGKTYTLAQLCGQVGMKSMSVSELRKVWGLKNAKGELELYRWATANIEREGEKPQKVYYMDKNEEGGIEWYTLRKMTEQVVEKWNARTILMGILQTLFADKWAEAVAKTVADSEKRLEGDVYTFTSQRDKGGVKNQAHKVAANVKKQIMF